VGVQVTVLTGEQIREAAILHFGRKSPRLPDWAKKRHLPAIGIGSLNFGCGAQCPATFWATF